MDALQKEGVKKTAVERALAVLVEQSKVNKKEYGKAKIFLLAQDALQLPDDQDIAHTDSQINLLSQELVQTKDRIAQHRQRATALKAEYTLQEALLRVSSFEQQLQKKSDKREQLGDGSALLSKEDKLLIDMQYYDTRTAWKKYRSLVNNILDQIGEGTGKKKSELTEEIGIETDEDVSVNFADFPEIANPLRTNKCSSSSRSAKRRRRGD